MKPPYLFALLGLIIVLPTIALFHFTEKPSYNEFVAACSKIPPIDSNLPQLYPLDTDGDGIVVLNKRVPTSSVTDIAFYPVKFNEIETKKTVWIYLRKYTIVEIHNIRVYRLTDLDREKLLIGRKVVDLDDGFVGNGVDFRYIYHGIFATQTFDCSGLVGIRVKLKIRTSHVGTT